jgi:hypothetical protein
MIAEPKCWTRQCKHFQGVKQDDEDETTERVVCLAFPDGIPAEIAYGNDPHDSLRGDDNGFRYEPEPPGD